MPTYHNEAMDYVLTQAQCRKDRVFEAELSRLSINGVQYASAVIYAEYLGLRVIGRIPSWVVRMKTYPTACPPNIFHAVNESLAEHGVTIAVDPCSGKGSIAHVQKEL